MKKRLAVAALSAVLAAGLLAGCGGSGGSAASSKASAAAGSAAASSAAASSATASSAAVSSAAASSAASSAAASSAAADGEFKKGLKGKGPTELTCRYADMKMPDGVAWEVYTYNASGTTGSVVMHIGKGNQTGSLIFEVSTTRLVGAKDSPTGKNKDIETLEEAANECYRMHGNQGKAKRTDVEKVKIGKYEYQVLTIQDDYNDRTYLASCYKTSDGKAAYVEVTLNNKLQETSKMTYKDGEGKAFLEGITLK